MVNIAKLLKDAPKGTKLYSPLFGEVKFLAIDSADSTIIVETEHETHEWFSACGKYKVAKSHLLYSDSECTLFPRKDYRTWQGWTPPVESNFKVGDWVVRKDGETFYGGNYAEQITLIDVDEKGKCIWLSSTSWVNDYDIRLWTIADAKEGDVLVCYSEVKGSPIEQAGIFKQYVGRHGGCSNTFLAHTGIDWDGNFIINGYMGSTNILPAPKEQRDLLFAKIKEAGYEWDADKKELKLLITNGGDFFESENCGQKPADKVEPNFKVGDWIVRGRGFVYEPSLITEIRDYYICELINGERVTYTLNDVHKNFHLWTIADAKEGDVLVVNGSSKEYKWIGIFKALTSDTSFSSHCHYNCGMCEFVTHIARCTKHGTKYNDIRPATNEERDILFAEMREAGYEWDAEKKELKKIQPHYNISNFKVGMPVLIRNYNNNQWEFTFFGRYQKDKEYPFRCADSYTHIQCIPYEGNEALLGTTDMCEERFINW